MSKELDYIADLEKENRLLGERCNQLLKDKGDLTDLIADIKANCDLAIEGRDIKIKELELELTVEKDQHQEEINLHLHAEDYIKSLEKENAELKEELAEWKDEWQEQVQKAIDEGYARTLQTIQLTKAKEILADIIKFQPYINRDTMFLTIGNDWKEVIYKAEQFLKGENIILEDAQAGNSPFDADEIFNKEMKAYPEEK